MQKILITGGQGDIAKAISRAFRTLYEVDSPSSKQLDVTDNESIKEYLKDKQVDILINNAGTIHPKRILDSDESLWERDIKVNLIGPYLMSKKVLTKNPQALIINISSTAAFNAYPDWSSYCASKAGLVTLTKCLANDGFKAFVLCPGAILTKLRDGLGLSNDNAMTADMFVEQVEKVVNGQYVSGDVIFFRKNELVINP